MPGGSIRPAARRRSPSWPAGPGCGRSSPTSKATTCSPGCPSCIEAGHPLANLDTGDLLADAGVTPLTAHAYLGGLPIAQALAAGADVVVTGRVTDAALAVGPGIWRFGWTGDDLDPLAGAVVAGHVLECGCQATGGNYCVLRRCA